MAGYLEKIAGLLPSDRREEWMNLASSHKAVFHDGDELILMIWTIALIGENMGEKSAHVVQVIDQWENEREGLSKERLAELVNEISQGIEEKAPSFKDLKTVTHKLETASRFMAKSAPAQASISPVAVCLVVIFAGVFSGLATFGVLWIKDARQSHSEHLGSSIPAVENFFAIIHGRGGEVEADDDQLVIKGTPIEIEQGKNQTVIRFK